MPRRYKPIIALGVPGLILAAGVYSFAPRTYWDGAVARRLEVLVVATDGRGALPGAQVSFGHTPEQLASSQRSYTTNSSGKAVLNTHFGAGGDSVLGVKTGQFDIDGFVKVEAPAYASRVLRLQHVVRPRLRPLRDRTLINVRVELETEKAGPRTIISDAELRETYAGQVVTVEGVVGDAKIPDIIGVEVDEADLRGRVARATGMLERYTVKPWTGDPSLTPAMPSPGVYYRLLDAHEPGRIARAEAIEARRDNGRP